MSETCVAQAGQLLSIGTRVAFPEAKENDTMTTKQANGLKRMCSAAGVGAIVAGVGMFTAVPTAIAAGLLVCWCGSFVTLIGYIDTLA